MDWHDLTYLRAGTPTQQAAYQTLQALSLMSILAAYNPVLVGTIPLDLNIPNSDLDIICQVGDLAQFEALLRAHFAHYPDFSLRAREHNDLPVIVCNFTAHGFPVEIFGQPRATEVQNAYRHLVAEARLLTLAGESARGHIRALKVDGLKTEPAFAEYFALEGDPYEALLSLADATDAALQQVLSRASQIRQQCLFCQIVADQAPYSLVYKDPQTKAIMNLRQANPGHVLVLPRRHVAQVYDLDVALSGAIMQTIVHIANALKTGLNPPGLSVWQSNGPVAGQEIFHVHFHLLPRQADDGHLQVYQDTPPVASLDQRDRLAAAIRAQLRHQN